MREEKAPKSDSQVFQQKPPPLLLTTDLLAELTKPGTQAVLGVLSAGGTCGRCPQASSQCLSVVGITSSPHSAEEPTGTEILSEPRGQRTSLSVCPPVQRTGKAILGAGLNLPASEPWFPKQRWPSSAEVMGGGGKGRRSGLRGYKSMAVLALFPEDSEGTEAAF